MSRLHLAKVAVRPATFSRLMLAGPPGAGKTKTALVIANEWRGDGRILCVDTEEGSALKYADSLPFAFDHVPWEAPYDPIELGEDLMKAASKGYTVGVIDSGS